MNKLWPLVASIPPGKVASYGDVGRALETPTTGYMVGLWMASCPEGLPWWRVVGKNGELRTEKRDPRLAKLQRELLEKEAVTLLDERVDMSAHRYEF